MDQPASILLKNISVYQEKNMVLAGIDLEIHKGEFVFFVGRTGSGKSTLLKALYAELPVKSGEATIAEFNLHNLKRSRIPYLRRKLGMVFQDYQLMTDRSVNENLRFVLKATGWADREKIRERIQTVLEKTGLGTKGFKMPYELSGGEQQRVAIARALLNDPEVILADEPTGNLDPETSEEIIQLLKDISASGRTVIVATHDVNILQKFPSRKIRFEKGRITETTAA
ncbi:MAG: ATP-binding cassette domain-containing protein [Bacteroidia bacterium]|nr:ATP-binding cassette domain-containing protein [Bacteroidia bacterium]